METDFLYHLNRALEEYKALKDFSQSNNNNPQECREKAVRACHLAHSPISNLVEAYCQFGEVKNNSANLFSLAAKINNIIDNLKLHHDFYIKPEVKDSSDKQRVSKYHLKFDEFSFWSVINSYRKTTSILHNYLELIPKDDQPKLLNASVKLHLDSAKELFISMCISLSRNISFEQKEQEKPKDYVFEYVNKWVNRTVTFDEIRIHTLIDYWDIIYDMKLDIEEVELIEQHQSKIFDDRVNIQVNRWLSDFDDLEEQRRKEAISSHIILIEQFLSGEKSELLIKRLENIFLFSLADEVIVAYDKLLLSDITLAYDKMIYNPKKYREYSAFFAAHLLYQYLNQLKLLLSSTSKKSRNATKPKSKTTRKSFGFTGDAEKLRNVLSELSDKINLLHDKMHLESLVSLMTTDDYRSEKHHIRLGCETVQFAYITGRLIPFFKQIKPIDIEESKAFFSKLNNKQILARDIHGKQDADVKSREEIDKIISYLK